MNFIPSYGYPINTAPRLEEILDETNQLDVSGKTRQWLQQEALNHNPKIEVTHLPDLFGFPICFHPRFSGN